MANKSAWLQIDENEKKIVFDFCNDYKDFLTVAKTERLACKEIIQQAKEHGFKDLEELFKSGEKFKAGDKFYINHKNKSVALFVMGTEDLENGLNIVGAHIDSPRLDVKQNPLYEANGISKLKTHYYGGVKLYQYATIPLAIHGVIYNKDNEKIEIHIGEDINDPVFCITDLLIHLSKNQLSKTAREALVGEQMNLVVGNIPINEDEKETVKANVLKILKEKYNIEEEDFKIAELEIVPAGPARDLGFDRSMVLSYGQDDRVCAFTTMRAIFEIEKPKRTACALFMDKEEIGSMGNTGMASYFWENTMTELVNLQGEFSQLKVNRSLKNSKVLSADVAAGFDPDFSDAFEPMNSSFMGCGITICKYTGSGGKFGSSDANAEFLFEIRKLFKENNIVWQTAELGKIDQGGGGTIALLLAKYGAEVLDAGPCTLSMHSPYELTSKIDVYMSYKAYKAFMK